jgi:hypothetical protein
MKIIPILLVLAVMVGCKKSIVESEVTSTKEFVLKDATVHMTKTNEGWQAEANVPQSSKSQLFYFDIHFIGKEARQRNWGVEFKPYQTKASKYLPISPKDYPDIERIHYYIIEDFPPNQ